MRRTVVASLFDPAPEQTLGRWLALLCPGGRIGLSTFGPTDTAWTAAEAVLPHYAPPALLDARTSGRTEPFASTASLTTMLQNAGAVDVNSHEEPLEVRLPDAAAWRSWTMTLGLRQFGEAVPPEKQSELLAEIKVNLDETRGDDGQLHLIQQVRYTVATAP